jgi:uncharacterized Zn-finger protein
MHIHSSKEHHHGFLLLKERRTKMQRGYSETSLIKDEKYKHYTKTVKPQNSPIWCNKHRDRNNHPQNTQRIWLPKYGSQSETTINTCL